METQLVHSDDFEGEESDEEHEDRGIAVAELKWKGSFHFVIYVMVMVFTELICYFVIQGRNILYTKEVK